MIPLCVDLDGTLVYDDTLELSALLSFKKHPFRFMAILPSYIHGMAALRKRIAMIASPRPQDLNYHKEFLVWLRNEHAQGRRLLLVSGTDETIAKSVAAYVGIFDDVIASDGVHNLSGEPKRQELVKRFGKKGFDYAGNHRKDLKVWKDARKAIVVNASEKVASRAAKLTEVEKVF